MADERSPSDSMRERAGTDGWKVWLLVDAPRWLVTAGVLAAVVVPCLLVASLSPDAAVVLRSADPVETLFQALLGATLTGVTLVVTLNQVVLSQELGPVGDQREKMDEAREFREAVAAHIDAPTAPEDPASLLRVLVEAADSYAGRLRDGVEPEAPESTRDRVGTLVEDVARNAVPVADGLADARFGTFAAVSAALDFEYAWKLSTARKVATDHDHLTDDGAAAAAELVEVLELYGSAREHVKTLYVQWELVNLSRAVLLAAVPATAVAVAMLVLFDPTGPVGGFAGVPWTVAAVLVAVGVTLSPFAVLVATVLRLATVAKRTLSVGAFTLRDTGGGEDDD